MSERPSVVRSARTVSLAVLGSRLLGLIREMVLAALFGGSAGFQFDAFLTAFRIPNLLRDLFAEGALSAAFVTTFTQKLTTEGDHSAWRLANLVLNALLIVLSAITLAGMIAAPWLVRLIAPGFADVPGKVELTIQLTRIMFPFLLMVAIAALAMGMLNAKHIFGIPASASMMFNVVSILTGVGLAWIFTDRFNPRDRAMICMAVGTLIGGVAQWCIQVPALHRVGYRYAPRLDWKDPGFQQVVRLVAPSVLGVGAVQVNVFVDNWFASAWNGGVTWLNCAFRLMQFPIGVFGVAIATATLPTASAHVARGDISEFRKTLARSIRLAFFLCVPAACGLALLANPIISVIYQHGRFLAGDTERTASCLRAFAVGLAGYAAIKVIAPTFYALGDSRTPMFVAVGSVVVNAALDYLFAIVLRMETAGLALSTSGVALTNFFLLLALMRRKIGRVEASVLLRSLVRIVIASATMTAVAYGAHRLLSFNRYVDVAGSVVAAAVAFAFACRLLHIEEFGELRSVLQLRAKDEPQGQSPRVAQ
jgi:putative peptidoglycan lipid II flippase